MKDRKFTFIDLFSGIGGFKIGLSNNGGECVGFSEVEPSAIGAYCENFNVSPSLNLGDITEITDLPRHDMLTAGVPCQSWSIAGRNLGFDDDRGQLWNDTLYLLKVSQPKVFIFENVKGLADPRNRDALDYIKSRIKEAGYHAVALVLNSFDYDVPQNRIRIYIIGFRNKEFLNRFAMPEPKSSHRTLAEILGLEVESKAMSEAPVQLSFYGERSAKVGFSMSATNGFNNYFLFNDIRNGGTTIHSWDIETTTEKEKHICLLLLKNRRKKKYGKLDGNPLSAVHMKELDEAIEESELDLLVEKGILQKEQYLFQFDSGFKEYASLSEEEAELIGSLENTTFSVDELKANRIFKLKRISIARTIGGLIEKNVIQCVESRYDFKNTKISTGLYGINRVFLPRSSLFSTLVASDSNDYISLVDLCPLESNCYRTAFLDQVFLPKRYRKITKEEACLIQGFPKDFRLPSARAKWMKLLGNSVSVPVIDVLCKAICETGVFDKRTF